MPLTLMGTNRGEQWGDLQPVPAPWAPKKPLHTPWSSGSPGGTLPHQPSLHRGIGGQLWGSADRFHPQSQALPPCDPMNKYPVTPCLPSASSASPSSSSAPTGHSSDRWRCLSQDNSQENAGKAPSPSHDLSSATLDSEKPWLRQEVGTESLARSASSHYRMFLQALIRRGIFSTSASLPGCTQEPSLAQDRPLSPAGKANNISVQRFLLIQILFQPNLSGSKFAMSICKLN